jgi:hypothetical protein
LLLLPIIVAECERSEFYADDAHRGRDMVRDAGTIIEIFENAVR